MNYTPLFIILFVSQVWCTIDLFPKNYNPEDDKIKVNEAIDENLAQIRELVRKTGYDPMMLPNISTPISVTIPWVLTQNVTINLTNGVLTGGSTLERAGDFYLTFHPHTVRANGHVYFKEMKGKFNFSYETGYSWIDDNGLMDVTIKNVTAVLSSDFDFYRLEVVNPKIKIENYGRLELEITSTSIFSPVTSYLSTIAANSYYKEDVLNVAQGVALNTTTKVLVKLNKNLPQLMADAIFQILLSIWNGSFHQQIRDYYNKHYVKPSYNITLSNNRRVFNNRTVTNNKNVLNNRRVFNNRTVTNNRNVINNRRVFNNTRVTNNRNVVNNRRIFNNTRVTNNRNVINNRRVFNNTRVFNNRTVTNNRKILNNKKVSNTTRT